MKIPCPLCGARASEEFTVLGDAAVTRPDPETATPEDWSAFVYLRDNPSGPYRELWQHSGGCRAWIVVERDTRTHEVFGAVLARDATKQKRETAA